MVKDSPVHVTTQRRHYVGKDGVERVYETHLLRRSVREDGKVRNEMECPRFCGLEIKPSVR